MKFFAYLILFIILCGIGMLPTAPSFLRTIIVGLWMTMAYDYGKSRRK